MGWQVVRDADTESTTFGEEAFAGISAPFEFVVFFFQTREIFVEFVVVRSVYVVGELIT